MSTTYKKKAPLTSGFLLSSGVLELALRNLNATPEAPVTTTEVSREIASHFSGLYSRSHIDLALLPISQSNPSRFGHLSGGIAYWYNTPEPVRAPIAVSRRVGGKHGTDGFGSNAEYLIHTGLLERALTRLKATDAFPATTASVAKGILDEKPLLTREQVMDALQHVFKYSGAFGTRPGGNGRLRWYLSMPTKSTPMPEPTASAILASAPEPATPLPTEGRAAQEEISLLYKEVDKAIQRLVTRRAQHFVDEINEVRAKNKELQDKLDVLKAALA